MKNNAAPAVAGDQSASSGILSRTTAADRGRMELPVLTPHLEYLQIDDSHVLLLSENFNTMLNGRIHCALLPLLQGRHTRQDIIDALAGSYSAVAVESALASLALRGYVVSGDHSMSRARAAYWSSLGASPCKAEKRLSTGKARVLHDDGGLSRALTGMGVDVCTDKKPGLTVVVCSDFLDEDHGIHNRQSIASGAPWILVRPAGMEALFGPVFRPLDQGPCWACLNYRLRAHQEVHNFVRNFAGNDAAFTPGAAEPVVFDAIHGLIAAEIAKWLVFESASALHEHALTVDVGKLKTGRHRVVRRPQCPVCGDRDRYRPDRPAVPLRLRPSPKTVINSGGTRSATPEETLARYRHLVSPVSGVVTWLESTAEESEAWLHTHWAGSNYALGGDTLETLRRSLRSKAAGKGSTSPQSAASALCEAVERYCGGLHGDEIVCRKRFRDFSRAGESEAIHPNDVQLFSDRQLDDADRINALDHPYNFIPGRFDPDALTDWTPVWSFTEERHRYLPTSLLYATPVKQRGPRGLKADSNGCAAGNTLEEAILQGFFELVERDAFAVWWYNRIPRPGVDLDSFGDTFLAQAEDYYRNAGRDLRVLDITHDFGIPVFVAVSRRVGNVKEDIIYGAGAHLDASVALLRAVCELNQFLNWLGTSTEQGPRSDINEPICLKWFDQGRLEDHPWLEAAPAIAARNSADYTTPRTVDARDDIRHCRKLVEEKGMELLVLDQTRPDIGMPVARVIVPGMRHFWERFAPGRLFDVPVETGWREHPLAEDDLNPAPVII